MEIEQIEKKLNGYKKDLDALKTDLAKQQGMKESLMIRLKNEFDLSSFDEIEKELTTLKKKKAKVISNTEELVKKIDEKYSEIFE